jgi:HD-GYP domain-containing protein (c-di-GMP phosphodiesterase class II)
MDADSVERVRVAGLMHDLGKFVIPEAVLAKRTPLTSEERSLLSRHAENSANMSLRLGVDGETAENIRHHHARFDGPGSTQGMRNEDIPLGARVLAVADAFVSMTTHRPYQAARSLAAAVRELRCHCGTQFDPTVVEAVPRALRSRAPGSSSTRNMSRHTTSTTVH